jgi:hypothetical protein
MSSELNLRFPDAAHVEATYDGEPSGMLPFASPLTDQDRRDLPWYLEIYGAHSLGDPDDAEAARIAARLPELGKAHSTTLRTSCALNPVGWPKHGNWPRRRWRS